MAAGNETAVVEFPKVGMTLTFPFTVLHMNMNGCTPKYM